VSAARNQGWNYASAGDYFITICTKSRKAYFGCIKQQKMELSKLGKMAEKYWYEIPEHAKNIELGAFVVMPNHIHGIISITENEDRLIPAQSKENPRTMGQQRFQNPWRNTIASIIGGYKAAVSKQARRHGLKFAWQTRFHDHIIRDDQAYHNITQYILGNPANWLDDKFHPNQFEIPSP